MKILLISLISFVFLCSLPMAMTSCAKKQIQRGEKAGPAPAKWPKAAPMAKVDDSDAKSREAERLARLRQLEKEQKLRSEMNAFESEHVYFDFDKSELKPEARAILKKKADWMRANPQYSVRIEGHCDERGTNEYNLALGERRANAAWKFINALGISGNRLSTISDGEERPADPGHNDDAWSKNRRDEFKLIK